jgi:predicted MPP superfamily phosphohydrolase
VSRLVGSEMCIRDRITVYPILLLYGLSGKEWPPAIAPVWWIPILMGAIGFTALAGATIRHWSYRPPLCEVSVVSQIIDLRTTVDGICWQDRLVGSQSRMRRVALLPGNEQFTIDVSTKTYVLPNLPSCWDGLTLVHLSDCHFHSGVTRAYFEAVCDQAAALNPDLMIFSGDLLDDQQRLEWLPQTLGRLRGKLGQFFVLGNHDWYLDHASTRQEFVRLGWTSLSQNPVTIAHGAHPDSTPLVLCGDETPWMGTHADLSITPADAFRILISHTPDNIGWARKNDIRLMLAGHTHGGQIQLPILGPIYSPSRYGCRFASGVFWLEPTLMYVSRGISGKEPIRYNCRPEVTRLVLRQSETVID